MAVETDDDLATFFDPDEHGVAAVYKVGGSGAGSSVNLIRNQPDVVTGFGETRIRSETTTFQGRVSDMPSLAKGDTLTIGAAVFKVQDRERDVSGRVWTIDTHPV